MSEQFATEVFFPYLFLPLFVGMWLAITTFLAAMSGWFKLQDEYPDRHDTVLGTMRFQSGQMGRLGLGGVSYGNCLRFDVCQTGLRIRVWKPLGPFCRPFFIPWRDVVVERKKLLFLCPWYQMRFGRAGNLSVSARTFSKLARLSRGSLFTPAP